MAEEPGIGADDGIIPIVAECDDSFLSDARRMQVSASDVAIAREAARAAAGAPIREAPAEGAVGAGTGRSCLGFKGGIGTSSRLVPSGHTVGVLVLSNFGERQRLTVAGVRVGRLLPPDRPSGGRGLDARPPAGSCITIVVNDAPLDSAACSRLARRAGLGLARTGSTAHHGSGEIFLAMATGLRAPRGGLAQERGPAQASGRSQENSSLAAATARQITGSALDPFFDAVVEATEEAVLNSMLSAPTVTGRDGNISPGLPAVKVAELLSAAGRIAADRIAGFGRPE